MENLKMRFCKPEYGKIRNSFERGKNSQEKGGMVQQFPMITHVLEVKAGSNLPTKEIKSLTNKGADGL